MRSEEGQYEVQAFEKIKTPKGEFDAFKLVMTMNVPRVRASSPWPAQKFGPITYYYAPDIKAHCFISHSRN